MNMINFSQEEKNEIYNLYNNNQYTLSQISKKFGCSDTAIRNLFLRNNWQLRQRKISKYTFDEHVFDIFDSNEKAFCLGLLLADGCNHYNSNQVSIELQARDIGVLEGMKTVFKSNHKLYFADASKYKNRKQDTYSLRLNSEYFSQRCSEIGFIPRKSLTLEFPYWLSEEYIPALLNGYIAGDGWVQKYVIGFMSTDKFCLGVKEYLDGINIKSTIMDMKRHYDKRTKELYINGKENISKNNRI